MLKPVLKAPEIDTCLSDNFLGVALRKLIELAANWVGQVG